MKPSCASILQKKYIYLNFTNSCLQNSLPQWNNVHVIEYTVSQKRDYLFNDKLN